MYKERGQYDRQKGVALITALLIVALVTVTAVAMTSRQQLDIRRTANILQGDQAYVFALGGEAFAKQVLKKDDAKVDHKEEDWATQLPPMPFQGGILQFTLDDLNGRFNLNNLVKEGKRSDNDVARFAQLLNVLKVKDEASDDFKQIISSDLANAVVDWIDADTDAQPGGAEDNDYLERERPYRAANQLMVSASELMLVQGFTPQIYKAIQPYVTALPVRTKINVNTAKNEVLQAMFEDIACPDPEKLNRSEGTKLEDLLSASTETQTYDKFTKVDDFLREDAFAGCALIAVVNKKSQQNNQNNQQNKNNQNNTNNNQGLDKETDVFSVFSEYFLLEAYAEVGPDDHRSRARLYSLLERKNGKITAVMRAQGTY
jgi:general secretion pathway protein K